MSKYKVGDVAALFPKPKKQATETQKKLQSLFEEFNSLKQESSKHFRNTKKNKPFKNDGTGDQDPRSPIKKKKRKFSELSSFESNSLSNDKKKYNQVNQQETAKSVDIMGKKEKFDSQEKDFPRKKKAKLNNSNEKPVDNFSIKGNFSRSTSGTKLEKNNANTEGNKEVSGFINKSKHQTFGSDKMNKKSSHILYTEDTLEAPVRQSNVIHNRENTKGNKVSGFIRKSKHQTSGSDKINKSSHILYTEDTKKGSGRQSDVIHNDELFKSEHEVSQNSPKKSKKKKNKIIGLMPASPSEAQKEPNKIDKKSTRILYTKDSQKAPVRQSDALHNNDELFKGKHEVPQNSAEKSKKKENKINGLMPVSQSGVQKGEQDFIKLESEQEYRKEELSRTLFVGNLPVNTTKKDIEKLFSVFGAIAYIRFRTIETNRNKIFRMGGPKMQNLNYAAETLPGFVVFKERQHAVDALSLSGSVFKNHHITVDFAIPPGSHKLYDKNRSIFIGNLPFDTQDESVWNAFSECGKIEGVRIVRDHATGIGKGFGYVLFNSIQGKENALSLEDVEIQGRVIRIKGINSDKRTHNKTEDGSVRRDPFKSRAIKYKKDHKDSGSRKSVTKIMKKQKELHKKKKIASLMQKSMK